MTTLAGTNATVCEGVNAVGTDARFCRPVGVALDEPAKMLYVADYTNNCVRGVNTSSAMVTTFAGQMYGSPTYTDGAATVAGFNQPSGVAYGAGTVFVTEPNYIRAVDVATRVTTTLAGKGWPAACSNGVGTNAEFSYPNGIAYLSGTVFVGDNCGWVRAIDVSTRAVTTLATSTLVYGSPAAVGAMTASTAGVLYFVANNQIWACVIATGVVTAVAGSGANDYVNGVGASAMFNHIYGIGVDDVLGKLYVSDGWNSRVRLVDISSTMVTDLVGGNYAYINGRGSAVGFMSPAGIAVDSASNIYVADNQNTAIRFIARAGV